MTEKEIVKKSKLLSLVLRHKPEAIGIELDKNGWANVDELKKKMNISQVVLEKVVEINNKKRFEFDEHKMRIRACQGHSIDVDVELEENQPPDLLYHGSATRFSDSIFKKGLIKGTRQHVHLSTDIFTAERVGQRHGKPVIFQVDTKKMFENSYKFFISNNDVWLTDHVPVEYLAWTKE